MLLTVALCTHNHADRLRRTLIELADVRPLNADFECLIVNNGSTDETNELLKSNSWQLGGKPWRIVREDKLGLSHARNRAIDEALGEYLLFMDDDETPVANWLLEYESTILTHRPDALGGRIEVSFEDDSRPRWLQDELLGFLGQLNYGSEPCQLNLPSTPFFGGNFCFRRDVFRMIGRFDPFLGRRGLSNVGGEDTEIYRRLLDAGCRVWWVPNAVIQHRIQAWKLNKRYFLELHFKQGISEAVRKRGAGSRIPPKYLMPQLCRALGRVLSMRIGNGSDHSLRLEMNVAYFLGYLRGWMSGVRT